MAKVDEEKLIEVFLRHRVSPARAKAIITDVRESGFEFIVCNPFPHTPCDWVGPDDRRCLLSLGHDLMKVGWQGHAPDRPVPATKPNTAVDPHFYPAPGLKEDQMTEDPHAKA